MREREEEEKEEDEEKEERGGVRGSGGGGGVGRGGEQKKTKTRRANVCGFCMTEISIHFSTITSPLGETILWLSSSVLSLLGIILFSFHSGHAYDTFLMRQFITLV